MIPTKIMKNCLNNGLHFWMLQTSKCLSSSQSLPILRAILNARPKAPVTRLYNGIAPLNDDSIAFLGHILLSNSFRNSEAQAIWTTAFFDKRMVLPETEQAEREVAYMNAFSRRKYPSRGATGAFFHFDFVGYTDKLMRDIGLKSHPKGWWWWWSDLTSPCLASDFKYIKDEYMSKAAA